jgi:peptide-methionine (R)-S-oxide reductase
MNQINPDLTNEQKKVLFEKGTEAPGSGKFLNHNEDGDYTCANCDAVLFRSDDKYDSTTPGLIGWPSFDTAVEDAIEYVDDNSLFMKRTEINCANCSAHMGHVFEADDAPSGTHFCINSASLGFNPVTDRE